MHHDSSGRADGASTNRLRRRRLLAGTAAAVSATLVSAGASAAPYGGSRHTIPGRIEAEDYDTDGSGYAYADTTSGNAGGAYRSDDVDIEAGGSGYNVGWLERGEWLTYSSTVEATGRYEVTARVASADGGGTMILQQDQADVGTIDVPDTTGWQNWTTRSTRVDLDAGDHTIAFYVDRGGFNVDYLEFSRVDGGGGGDGDGGSDGESGGGESNGDGPDEYPGLDGTDWELVWSDEFDQSSIDTAVWSFETGGGCGEDGRLNTDCSWGNEEEQYYTDGDNAWIENGRLVIEAREELAPNGENQYTSARLITAGAVEKQYGRVAVRARLPETQGLWPAIWMLGSDFDTVGWPECGEIDIMELLGDDTDTVHQTIHGPGYAGGDGITAHHDIAGDFSQEFHDFQLTWDADGIRFWVDSTHVNTVTPVDVGDHQWVFDDRFYLLLNVAVGGLLPGYPNAETQLPQRMDVEYVRVYDRR